MNLFSGDLTRKARRSLEEQYNIVFDILIIHKPEWCFYMSLEDDIEEFHHQIFKLPFYKSIFCIEKSNNIFIKESLFCMVDDSVIHNLDLFRIKTWKYTKVIGRKPKIVENIINLSNGAFEELFGKMMHIDQDKEYTFSELPSEVADKILF
jgi:hypothetical protein